MGLFPIKILESQKDFRTLKAVVDLWHVRHASTVTDAVSARVTNVFFSFSRMWRRSSVIQTDIEEEADLVNRLTSSDGTFPVWELLCFGFFSG